MISEIYAGIWNILEYNGHIPNIVDDFAVMGPSIAYISTTNEKANLLKNLA